MKLKAYAKINLTLDVTGRREDGYHTLDTVMQTISVWDEVEIKKINKPGIRLFCNREYLPVDTKNTAFRAAQYFFCLLYTSRWVAICWSSSPICGWTSIIRS